MNATDLKPIHHIFVPQGAEFQAVQRGLRSSIDLQPILSAMQMGPERTTTFFQTWKQTSTHPKSILVMGLCGSLHPSLAVGDVVLYEQCRSLSKNPYWTSEDWHLPTLEERLGCGVTVVTGLMCDRIVHQAAEKRHLAQITGADVVDMEGYAILEALADSGVSVTMLRVVSDDAHYDWPDLSSAVSESGDLLPFPLAWAMVRQPVRAARMVRGSLRGLKQLEAIAAALFR